MLAHSYFASCGEDNETWGASHWKLRSSEIVNRMVNRETVSPWTHMDLAIS